jgi:hypothetical protein
LFRERDWLAIKDELGLEQLDVGMSRVFAVADHQIAHIHINDRTLLNRVRTLLESVDGIATVWGETEKRVHGLDHSRSGDLIALAKSNAWFTYYYWLEDQRAPDFARTVDIHRKPGFDPVELFINPRARFQKFHIARRLLQKRLGFRMLMDVIPLDASLVKGSHGASPADSREWPVLITSNPSDAGTSPVSSTDIHRRIIEHFRRQM